MNPDEHLLNSRLMQAQARILPAVNHGHIRNFAILPGFFSVPLQQFPDLKTCDHSENETAQQSHQRKTDRRQQRDYHFRLKFPSKRALGPNNVDAK